MCRLLKVEGLWNVLLEAELALSVASAPPTWLYSVMMVKVAVDSGSCDSLCHVLLFLDIHWRCFDSIGPSFDRSFVSADYRTLTICMTEN